MAEEIHVTVGDPDAEEGGIGLVPLGDDLLHEVVCPVQAEAEWVLGALVSGVTDELNLHGGVLGAHG